MIEVKEMLDKIRPKGQWVVKGSWNTRPVCSECGAFNNSKYKNFCPNCGADMRNKE